MDSGLLGFPGLRQPPAMFAQPPGGTARGLALDNVVGSETTKVTIAATAIVLEDRWFNSMIARSVSVTVDTAVTGPGGLEIGTSLTNSQWYYLHVIANPSSGLVRGLISSSSTAPILPAGFTFSSYVGPAITDGSSLLRTLRQRGRRIQYFANRNITSGAVGNPSSGSFAAVPVANYVPTTAVSIRGYVSMMISSASAILAPNSTSYAGTSATTQAPPVVITTAASNLTTVPFDFILESSNIYYASSTASCYVSVLGWDE